MCTWSTYHLYNLNFFLESLLVCRVIRTIFGNKYHSLNQTEPWKGFSFYKTLRFLHVFMSWISGRAINLSVRFNINSQLFAVLFCSYGKFCRVWTEKFWSHLYTSCKFSSYKWTKKHSESFTKDSEKLLSMLMEIVVCKKWIPVCWFWDFKRKFINFKLFTSFLAKA